MGRNKQPEDIDFDMDASRFKGEDKATWPESILSTSMLLFHGILVITVIVVMFACIANKGGTNG